MLNRSSWVLAAVVLVVLVAVASFVASTLAPRWIGPRIRAAAAERHLAAEWSSLRVRLPSSVSVDRLRLVTPGGDTVLAAREVRGSADLLSLLTLRPRPTAIQVRDVHIDLGAVRDPAADTLEATLQQLRDREDRDRLPILRRNAQRLVAAITRPPSQLPRIDLERVTVVTESDEDRDPMRLHIERARLQHRIDGTTIAVRGNLELDSTMPFDGRLDEKRDGAVRGRLRLDLPAAGARPGGPVLIDLEGRIDRRRGGLRLLPGSRLRVGPTTFDASGALDRRGPSVAFALAGDQIRPDSLRLGLPAAALGPLRDLGVTGTFDYRLSFGLDLEHPEAVDYRADVIPHGLALAPATTRLNLKRLDGPFTATIHLPRGRGATRTLSPANPHFLPLEAIDPTLVSAVVTNEDGGFFRHRGFNTDAVKESIVENLKAGAFRRGAGTITMQLMRNLYLGHDRTLARKAQEVVLAWLVEHLAGVSKRRLLEIYLNVIEWGPGVHGVDEASYFYFGHGAGSLTVSEALFLSIVIPSPSKWRWRFDAQGNLRRYARAQMHFIGRAMIAKGWLDPSSLPSTDAMYVSLGGRALESFPARVPADSAARDTAGVLAHGLSPGR